MHEGFHAVRQIGIRDPRDFLTFDFAAHRRTYLESQLFKLDFEILGRSDQNRRTKSRYRKPVIGSDAYNRNVELGLRLFEIHGKHPPEWTDRNGVIHFDSTVSLQRFVDQYGRGGFLIPVTMLDLPRMAHGLTTHAARYPKVL